MEELQVDCGPVRENNYDSYILFSIDTYSRYPHA